MCCYDSPFTKLNKNKCAIDISDSIYDMGNNFERKKSYRPID